MTLQVIGVGFGRTGTLSLKQALEQLGLGPCEHMSNLASELDRIPLWLEAARRKEAGEPINWESLFAGYRATVDWPGTFFWRELVAAYPDARFILPSETQIGGMPVRWRRPGSQLVADDERSASYPPKFVAALRR